MFSELIDVKEGRLAAIDSLLLEILLMDRTTRKYIKWATDNYSVYGKGYLASDSITPSKVIGKNSNIIRPRIKKSVLEQECRIRDKAEVFTTSWLCNKQNNLVDDAWFGYEHAFNKEVGYRWYTTKEKIIFPNDKSWQDYVSEKRLEISCGEAPYLASRYDTVTGKIISPGSRIGLLDRKLRVIHENVNQEAEWLKWVKIAFQSVYGYEWQGDSLLIARENLLYTFIDYYRYKFQKKPELDMVREVAYIISWNVWQMDGLKYVVPESCKRDRKVNSTICKEKVKVSECYGCKKGLIDKHNGIYCKIMDWEKNKRIRYIQLLKRSESL